MTSFGRMLDTDRILIIKADRLIDKKELLSLLCERISKAWDIVGSEQLLTLVHKREETFSTRLGPMLAVPHAVIPGGEENRMAAAVIPNGVEWDSDTDHPVRLVFLLVGGQEDHLKLLSELAAALQDETFLLRLTTATSPKAFLSVFRRRDEGPVHPFVHRHRDLSAAIFEQALRLRDAVDGARIILHADALGDGEYIDELIRGKNVLVVSGGETLFDASFLERYRPIIMPFRGIRRSIHVQFILLYLLGRGVIGEDDLIVNAYGKPGSGFLDSIRLSHLKRELNLPFSSQSGAFPTDLELSTFARVLQLASQLAAEGREGKPVGTLFVVGDQAGVYPYTRQMIVNPFHGYADSDKNILDPSIEETVKEYAKIDGAFIIRGDGTILSAGTFLSGQPTADEMQSGLGARHAAAQGITAVSKALAIAISESTRKVTVFQSGRRVMEL
ncbi:diadenylate cyclase [Sediminispirochaeta smaragdinae]|uniref:DAC domain-containing protein n=1 Tax=Sediminispirochaeta smaragdinae (strain DSM 11293 / JCM 15392 / SEBR 4228) TaxID=573413 RepID=E1R427_SEDSS|nr:PTS sugar transporter subunit IIA [Sediminispirochaeta smaragdinae]ADK80449.1 protein of unknown function DUF147 [Sediminispirochaeta smaragdinae DSM 11293]